ncbi:hypothetical protein [Glycomyces paridis]|uniref:Uncharacterized protein n=1 Tax=Glycomyces paridis TaxID=2126555 RepID=A0A4V4HNZ1_9ACTN|nr:hypothetical protein [Glycomyces paridis]THV27936.1 hypothetical protein E9998_13175 [Glycomyces paridis]
MTSPRCGVCGDARHACGDPSDVTPVDARIERSTRVGNLKRYNVTMHGHETVMLLNEAKAKALGATPYTPPPPPPPAPAPVDQTARVAELEDELAAATAEAAQLREALDALTDDNGDGASGEPAEPEPEAKAKPAPANKARTAPNKGR